MLKDFIRVKSLTPDIRIAKLQDAEAIARTHICSWQKMYKEFIPEMILQNLSIEERTQQWLDYIKQKVQVLVIEVNNQIIGFASICSFRAFGEDNTLGEISAIYMHPEYWRKGLGTKLCLAAISALEKKGYKKVLLWVFEDNIQARKFYDSLGFELASPTKLEELYDGGALLKEVLYQKTL